MSDKITPTAESLRNVADWHDERAAEKTKAWERSERERHRRIAADLRRQADAIEDRRGAA